MKSLVNTQAQGGAVGVKQIALQPVGRPWRSKWIFHEETKACEEDCWSRPERTIVLL